MNWKWKAGWAVLGAACGLMLVCMLSILAGAATLELVGSPSGNGSHVMEIMLPGNFSPEDGPILLAYHGYNVSRDGRVWMKGEAWNVTGAM